MAGRGTVNAYGVGSNPTGSAFIVDSTWCAAEPYNLRAPDWCAGKVRILHRLPFEIRKYNANQ